MGRINGVDECKPKTKKEEAETLENQDKKKKKKTVQKMIRLRSFAQLSNNQTQLMGLAYMSYTNVFELRENYVK